MRDFFNTCIHRLLPKRALTDFAGFMANMQIPLVKNYLIRNFIQDYQVNMQAAIEEDPTRYACFNDFFIRKLKPELRPIANTQLVSPVDGVVSEYGSINQGTLIQAKGHDYTVQDLLATDAATCLQFNAGYFATFYLSPKDYHRVHMPTDARLTHMVYVPGKLYSVKPSTVRNIPRLFARNERLVAFFTTINGPMAMVLVGATLVGAIGTAWGGDIARGSHVKHFNYPCGINLSKAAEMGYFKLGSTVIVLFANKVQWSESIAPGVSVCYGEALGEVPV